MNRVLTLKSLVTLLILGITLQSCIFGGKKGDGGELIGVQDREWTGQVLPYGMTSVPPGTFHMGQSDEDITSSKINMNKQITIGGFYMEDTEITNNEYRQFIYSVLGVEGYDAFEYDSIHGPWTLEEVLDFRSGGLYPDTTVWINDFAYHMGEPMTEYYYIHPAFDDYPVVGVSWYQAQEFCKWRTAYLNNYREENGMWPMPNFRLPSEAEWEYAARGGLDQGKYPWGGPYARNGRGCALANFKPGRGNYIDDGFAYSSPVGSYFANGFGLYDMAGNVSEWCEDAYHPASYPIVWDLNPTYFDKAEPRKLIRGGSWKDIPFYIETGTRNYEFQDTMRSFIGFRCVMTYLGRSSGYEF